MDNGGHVYVSYISPFSFLNLLYGRSYNVILPKFWVVFFKKVRACLYQKWLKTSHYPSKSNIIDKIAIFNHITNVRSLLFLSSRGVHERCWGRRPLLPGERRNHGAYHPAIVTYFCIFKQRLPWAVIVFIWFASFWVWKDKTRFFSVFFCQSSRLLYTISFIGMIRVSCDFALAAWRRIVLRWSLYPPIVMKTMLLFGMSTVCRWYYIGGAKQPGRKIII